MATPGGANEKTGVAEVRLEHPEHHHHKEINVIPIEQEAVQDAVHIDLTWRSWVLHRHLSLITDIRADKSATSSSSCSLPASRQLPPDSPISADIG